MRLLFDRGSSVPPGELDDEDLITLYRHPPGLDGRGWVRSNFVTSLDGSISGSDGQSESIGTPSDQRVFMLHRALADVVLVGAQTVRAERYRAVDLAPWQRAIREREGLAPFPLLAVVSRSLDLDPQLAHPAAEHGPTIIVTEVGRAAGLDRFEDAGWSVIDLAGGGLTGVVRQLAAGGWPRILCEGGPGLHRDLLADDLVDELSLTLSPTVVGGDGRRTTHGESLPAPLGFALERTLYAADDETLLTSYRRARA